MSGTGGGPPSATYDAFMRMETGRVSDEMYYCSVARGLDYICYTLR